MDLPGPIRLLSRHVLHVGGEEARDFLETLLTCRTADLGATEARYGALLTPQGKIVTELFASGDGANGVHLDAPASAAELLESQLKRYRLRRKITLTDKSGELAVVQHFAAQDADHPNADPRGAAFGTRTLVPLAEAPDADEPAYLTARIGLGLCEQGDDYAAESVFPSDVNMDLLNGVDYAKGCFVGQEVASRMRRRGSVRKRTLAVRAEPGALAKGAQIEADGLALGDVIAAHDAAGLAIIRIDRLAQADRDRIQCAGAPVEIVAPPWFPDEALQPAEA